MPELQKFVKISLPCLKFSPFLALSPEPIRTLEVEIKQLESYARSGRGDVLSLAKKQFPYADYLQNQQGLEFASDAFKYFFKHHNCTPSENIRNLNDERCQTNVVRLVDPDSSLVEDMKTGKKFSATLTFTPGEVMLKELDKLPHLVLMQLQPKVYVLDDKLKEKIRQRLRSVKITVGPLVDLDYKYYIMHWGVLCHELTPDEAKSLLS